MLIRCYGGLFDNHLVDAGEIAAGSTPPLVWRFNVVQHAEIASVALTSAGLGVGGRVSDIVGVEYGLARRWGARHTSAPNISDEWFYVALNYLGEGRVVGQ